MSSNTASLVMSSSGSSGSSDGGTINSKYKPPEINMMRSNICMRVHKRNIY